MVSVQVGTVGPSVGGNVGLREGFTVGKRLGDGVGPEAGDVEGLSVATISKHSCLSYGYWHPFAHTNPAWQLQRYAAISTPEVSATHVP
jgi:hypothetical protein